MCDPQALQGNQYHINHGLQGDTFFFFSSFGVAERDVQIDPSDFPSLGRCPVKNFSKETCKAVDCIQRKHLNGEQNNPE
jgi:hypothetical protein